MFYIHGILHPCKDQQNENEWMNEWMYWQDVNRQQINNSECWHKMKSVICTNMDTWLRFLVLHVGGIDLFLVHISFTRLGLQQETTLDKWMQQILKIGMLQNLLLTSHSSQ